MMTRTLQRAVKKVSALPSKDQEAFARWMLLELADDVRWRRTLRRTSGKLKQLAHVALADHKAGRTKSLDLDRS
jgi:hypothetical protein